MDERKESLCVIHIIHVYIWDLDSSTAAAAVLGLYCCSLYVYVRTFCWLVVGSESKDRHTQSVVVVLLLLLSVLIVVVQRAKRPVCAE